MALRFFNGIQIDVPEGWSDLSTVIVAPRVDSGSGEKPSINLVVKRRPAKSLSIAQTLRDYVAFMKATFGTLSDLQTKEVMVGSVKGTAIKFNTEANGRRFMQMTLVYHAGGDEISATVTQVEGDSTSLSTIERLLKSIRPAGAGGIASVRAAAR
jgi:hypothetical protein